MATRTRPHRERRKRERRAFPHYLRFLNDATGELVGDLADISTSGFKLEGSKPVPVGMELPFRVDLPPDIAQGSSMVFTARSRWSQQHPIDARLYAAGFEITDIDSRGKQALELIFERYGSTAGSNELKTDYLWTD